MKPAYRLLALDMDGTVLNEESLISERNQYWIRKAQEAGVYVSFCTGRGVQTASPYVEQMELTTPLVTVNGSEVWKRPGALMVRHEMDMEHVLALREIAIKHDIWYWAYAVDGVHNRENWADKPEESIWLKFGYYTENVDVLHEIWQEAEKWNAFELSNSHPFNMELNPRGVHKAAGLRHVCSILDITMDEVVAVGDSLNDATMIREAGLGVAMGNAQDAVKSIADWVTLSNDEDGVAELIEKKILST